MDGVQVAIIIELHWWASWQCLSNFRMNIPCHILAIRLLGICSSEMHKCNRKVQCSKLMQTTLAFLNNNDQINCGTIAWWLKRTRIYVLILCKYCKRKKHVAEQFI